jgi:hypothetical protein
LLSCAVALRAGASARFVAAGFALDAVVFDFAAFTAFSVSSTGLSAALVEAGVVTALAAEADVEAGAVVCPCADAGVGTAFCRVAT